MASLRTFVPTVVIIVLLFTLSTAQFVEDDEDEDMEFFGGKEYYDPDDMLNFNQMEVEATHSKPSLKDKVKRFKDRTGDAFKKIGKKVKDTVLKCDYDEYKKNITNLQKQVEDCKREKKILLKKMTLLEGDSKKEDKHTPVLMPFIKRYVLFLQEQFAEQSPFPANSEYAVRMSVSEESRAVLNRFGNPDSSAEAESDGGKGSIQDVFFALEAMMVKVELIEPEQLLEEEVVNSRFGWIKENLTLYNVFLMVAVGSLLRLTLSVPLRFSWLSVTWRSLVAMFLISVPWNWFHLYMVAVARQNREMLKDIPANCVTEGEQGFWSGIVSAFSFTKDECLEHHIKLAVDPFWEVTPTMALAVTITKTVTEPLELVSKGMSRFIRGFLEDLPLHLQGPVFLLSVVMLLLMLIMVFGYNVRLFHFFRIEEAPRQPGGGMIRQVADLERDQQIQDRDAQIQALQGEIQAQQERTRAIEGRGEALEGENLELKEQLKKMMQKPLSKPAIGAAPAQTPAETPALPLVSNPQMHQIPDRGVEKASPKSTPVSIPLKKQQSQPNVATIGPQPRTPERPDDDDEDLKPEERETPRMVLASSSDGFSQTGSTPTGVKSLASSSAPTSPVAAVPPLVFRQQTSGVVDEEDEEEDIYSPSLPPGQSTAQTDLTATGTPRYGPNLIEHRRSDTDLLHRPGVLEATNPTTQATSGQDSEHRGWPQEVVEDRLPQRRSDSAVMSRFLQEQLPVNPMTHSTDRYSEHNLSEGGQQLPGPSCCIQFESAVKGIRDEQSSVSSLGSAEMSGGSIPKRPAAVPGNPAVVCSNPPFTILPAVAMNTAAVGSGPMDAVSLSGSWVGVGRDGVMEEGQGDANRSSAPVEDSDDGIAILDEEEENNGLQG